MTLGEVIKRLEALPQDAVVKHGFGNPHSDRGNYCNIAFTPKENVTIASMLEQARLALGDTFEGYKGGYFKMDEYTDAFIGDWGLCGEEITTSFFRVIEMEIEQGATT